MTDARLSDSASSNAEVAIVLSRRIVDFTAVGDGWQLELDNLLGRQVSFELLFPGDPASKEALRDRVLLWRR